MPAKPKILFIGDYCRTDYLSLLDKAKDDCDFWFLYYSTPNEEQNKAYKAYGQAAYWSDYKSTQALLDVLAPRKVLFLYIDTYHALVLNITCKNKGIPTYHLEHGMRADYVIGYDVAVSPELHQKPYGKLLNLARILKNLGARIRSRIFLKNSIRHLPATDAAYVEDFIAVRSKHNFLETFKQLPSSKRNADSYISFSPCVFKIHQQFDQLESQQKVHFIGIPYFDALANVAPTTQQRAILFIDQPLAEHRLLQWTPAYKKTFVTELVNIATLHNYKLYVKAHPLQDYRLWQEDSNVRFINDQELVEICGSIPVVMGFYSTYLMPFAAMPHITLLTLENHPAGKLNVSRPFTDTGVGHPVYDLEELPWALDHIEQLHQQQLPNKEQFKKDWLYQFDGKSGERLRDILLSDSL